LSPTVGREDRRLPKDVEARITAAGGRNFYGQPNYRIVWGESALKSVHGLHEAVPGRAPFFGWYEYPKYETDRWHLEVWLPPSAFGNPEAWPTDELGPFPSRGDYEHVVKLEDAWGGHVEPCGEALEWLIRMISKGSRDPNEIRRRMEERDEAKEKASDREANDIYDDAMPAYSGRPFVVVP
jgi:hypothetical protein